MIEGAGKSASCFTILIVDMIIYDMSYVIMKSEGGMPQLQHGCVECAWRTDNKVLYCLSS